jgi:hypothetical protein
MAPRFFQLRDDVYARRRWHLNTPTDSQGRALDDWQFTRGTPVSLQDRLKCRVEIKGRSLDFSEAGLGVPVVHARVATVFAELAPDDVQLLPVDVDGQPDPYLVLVATRLIHCIDEPSSKVDFWTPEDGLPHKVGQYCAVDDLHIDKSRVGNARVFRPQGWAVALIVREEIKDALTRMGATGVKFEEV